jgi:hypothetical protein
MTKSESLWRPWFAAVGAAEALEQSLTDLRLNREATIESARSALMHVDQRREALLLLGCLGTDLTAELTDSLLRVALSDRDTVRVRNLLGRLPRKENTELVPNAVWQLLDKVDDGDAYRRMAELLHHLGLDEALRDLCARARESIDPDIREVAEAF